MFVYCTFLDNRNRHLLVYVQIRIEQTEKWLTRRVRTEDDPAMTSNPTYIVEDNERDINASDVAKRFANTLLKSKAACASWISSTLPPTISTEQIVIPRAPLRRLHPAHAAIKGTAEEYESKLLNIFPALADIEPSEIEKTLRRMRGRQETEP